MTKNHYMPLFVETFLADTAGLSLEEQGAYIRLLCHLWINCGKLVDNDGITSRILGIHVNKWRKIKKNLGGYLPSNPPGYLSNPRLQKELDRVEQNRMKKAAAATTRWVANGLKNKGRLDASASDVHMQNGYGCICRCTCRCISTCMPFASPVHRHIIINIYNILDLTVGDEQDAELVAPSRVIKTPSTTVH